MQVNRAVHIIFAGWLSLVMQTGSADAESGVEAILQNIQAVIDNRSERGFTETAEQLRNLAEAAWGQQNLQDGLILDGPDIALKLKLVDQIDEWLTPSQRDQLLTSIFRQLDNNETIQTLSPHAVSELTWVVRELNGSSGLQASIAKIWLGRATNLETADTNSLAGLYVTISKSLDTDAQKAQLVTTAWDRMLADQGKPDALQGDGLHAWLRLASWIARDLSSDQRSLIQEWLLDHVAYNDEQLLSLDSTSVRYLVRTLRATSLPTIEINYILAHWIDRSDNFDASDPYDLRDFANRLKYGPDLPSTQQARSKAASLILDRYLTDRAYLNHFLEVEDLSWHINVLGMVWTPEQQQQFARFYYRYLLLDSQRQHEPSLVELKVLGKILNNAGLDTGGLPLAGYAEAVSDALERADRLGGHYYWNAKFIAAPLRSESSKQRIHDVLIGESGQVNLDAGRILAFIHLLTGQTDAWKREVSQHLETANTPDQQAAWMLLSSYAQEIEAIRWAPLIRRDLLLKAMKTAESEPIRLEVIDWYVWRLIETNQYEEADRVIRDQLQPMTSDQAVGLYDRLQSELAEAKSSIRVSGARNESVVDILRRRIRRLEQNIASPPDDDKPQSSRREALELLRDQLSAYR